MATRLIVFEKGVILNPANRISLLTKFNGGRIPEELSYTEQVFEPGKSYSLNIPETSASYTLAMREDGGGVLERVMAKPGARYGSSISGGENLEGLHNVQTEKEQKIQQFVFAENEHLMIPIAVGSKEGDKVWAIFYNNVELSS